jgi:SAM-dependent MidA family methyltransferase
MEPEPRLGKPELIEKLRTRISKEGPLSFADFMQEALYAPDLGYYTSPRRSIGRSGDFFTNVSVGPLFGRLLALQIADIHQTLGTPNPFLLLEQGAHNGRLITDVLTTLQHESPETLSALQPTIIEPDPHRQTWQIETLGPLAPRCRWIPEPIPNATLQDGVFFSNELPDSFPVHRIRFENGEWKEMAVDWSDSTENFVWRTLPLTSPELAPAISKENIPELEGYETELSLATQPWLERLLSLFSRGVIFIFDYAMTREELYRPDRSTGTLRTYFQHTRGTDPLQRIGEQDITTHVNISPLIELANQHGWDASWLDQHHALAGWIAAYLPDHSPRLKSLTFHEKRMLQTLVHPGFMGKTFSVLILKKGWPPNATPPAAETFRQQ